jgi:hypothetical protein
MKKLNVVIPAVLAITFAQAGMWWQTTTNLPRASWRHACAAANGFLYFLGGGNGPEASCYYARIGLDGMLGDWQPTS